jgi:RNA polymerase sigma-70 factor, ECF subfamily
MQTEEERAEERQAVRRAKEDMSAFGVLYDLHFQRIYRFVFSRVRDQTVAEDVTSEVFIKALHGIRRYRDTGRPFAAWLYQIAVNAVTDRFRAARPLEDIDDQQGLSDGFSLEDLATDRDQLRRIWSLIEALPQHQRVALALRFQEDMRIDDIAAVMGKSVGAVKILVHRGVATIRRQVAEAEMGGRRA